MASTVCRICGTQYKGEGAVNKASTCGKGKVPRYSYKIGTTYLTGQGGRLKVLSSRVILSNESHIRLYSVEWIRGHGEKEMTMAQMNKHNMQGIRAPGGLDIDVPDGADFRITQTSGAGVNKKYRIRWKDSSKPDKWVTRDEVIRLTSR